MKISEDRYRRELQSIEVALRFLRHAARTRSIETWTGLTNDRIRNLYRSYVARTPYMPRHRGRAPQRIGHFTRSVRMQEELASLARALSLIGAIPPPGADCTLTLPNLTLGRLICDAYEIYAGQYPNGQISLEHALFLTTLLFRRQQLALGYCTECGGLLVIERYSVRLNRCTVCAVSFKR